jgi:hypothetical protein
VQVEEMRESCGHGGMLVEAKVGYPRPSGSNDIFHFSQGYVSHLNILLLPPFALQCNASISSTSTQVRA